MELNEILSRCDHTLLKPECTWEQIREVCDDGLKFNCASVCIPAGYVKQAGDYLGDSLKICTVIGFPNGYSRPPSKSLRPKMPFATAPMRSTWSSISAG